MVVFVVFVVREQFLEAVLLQELDAVLQVLFVHVLPLALPVLVLEADLARRIERRLHFVAVQRLPVKVFEPWVYLNFGGAVRTEPLDRLPLYQAVDEVDGVLAPALGYFFWVYLDLFGENVVPYFFSAAAIIRPTAHHALISYYADGVVVHADTVILLAHDLWGHVAWRAAALLRVVFLPQFCDSEVGNLEIAFRIKNQILWFEVPVNY